MGVRSTQDITRERAIERLRDVKLNELSNDQLGELLEVLNPFENYIFIESPSEGARLGDFHGD